MTSNTDLPLWHKKKGQRVTKDSKKYLPVMLGLIVLILPVAAILLLLPDSVFSSGNDLTVYIPMYRLLKETESFFTSSASVPILGSFSRNYLPSECNIISLLYYFLSIHGAYVIIPWLRVLLALFSCTLLSSRFFDSFNFKRVIFILLPGLLYGLIPVDALHGFALASIPLLIFILMGLSDEKIKNRLIYFALLLVYPMLSCFFHVGIYLIAILLILTIVLSVKEHKFKIRLFLGILVLIAGFAATEYRTIAISFEDGFSFKENMTLVSDGLKASSHPEDISYSDYYAEDLFDEILEDIDYMDEWSCAYNMDPGVLIYNDIKTIDGYTGIKTKYEELYLSELAKGIPLSVSEATGKASDIDIEEFKSCDGRYIFSNGKIEGLEDEGFILCGSYGDVNGNYEIYVYRTKSRYHAKEHSDIPYSERSDFTYDTDEYLRIKEEMLSLAEDDSNLNTELMMEDYAKLESFINDMDTAYQMSNLAYCKDVANEELYDEVSRIYEDFIDYYDDIFTLLRDVCDSAYRECFEEELGKSLVEGLLEYEEMTEEEKDREIRLESLSDEYEQAINEDYYYEYQGKEWNFDMLYASEDDLDDDEYLEIYFGIYESEAAVIGEIYKEIISINNEIAKSEGYDNYAEYAYETTYFRDYTVEDAKSFLKQVRKNAAKYIGKTEDLLSDLSEYDPGFFTEDDTATFEFLLPYIESIDPELGVSLRYLIRNELYDLKNSDTKSAQGFTVEMDSFGDAYIYDSPYVNAIDLFTYIHEFGHFNNTFYSTDSIFSDVSTLDVSEIQSQGLEMLMCTKYDEMFDEGVASFLETYEVRNIMYSVLSGAMVGEFEIYAYENPDATVEELGEYYLELYDEYYGTNVSAYTDAYYGFIDITHIFEQSMYYISYATSAIAALEIYDLSLEDYDLACEKYMELSSYPSNWQFKEVLEYMGLEDPFSQGTVKDILSRAYNGVKEDISVDDE